MPDLTMLTDEDVSAMAVDKLVATIIALRQRVAELEAEVRYNQMEAYNEHKRAKPLPAPPKE